VPDPHPFARRASLLRRSEPRWPTRPHWQTASSRPEGEVLRDPSTWPEPSTQYACEDTGYGAVRVRAFSKMHPKVCAHEGRGSRGPLPIVVGTLVLVEVERLPRGERRRKPRVLWLRWHGPERDLPLSQTGFGMEHPSGKAPRTGRPVDVAGFSSFHPAEAGAGARSGPEAALGTSLRRRSTDTSAGPSRSFGAFGRARHTRQAAETLWTLSWAAQRTALGPGEALPGSQEDGLNPHEDRERGSFARDFISIPKLLCLERKVRLTAAGTCG
jgi:hypothetical protein